MSAVRGWALAAMLCAAGPGLAHADATTAFVQENADKILALAPRATGDAAARAQLLTLVNRVLDVDGIARFALGPYARQMSAAQMRTYLDLFHKVISNGVVARLATYSGAKMTIGRSLPADDGTTVESTIARAGSSPADVDWLIGGAGGSMRIEDVIAERTSLRQTERDDYTSFLQNHGGDIDGFLAALQRQVGT